MTLNETAPEGSLTITAVGLGDAIAALSSAADDPAAAKILGVLTLAQSMATKDADGAAKFVIEMKENGAVSVNGQMVKPPNGHPL